MTFDEKRHVILPLLDELRPYNHAIGSYDKSMFTESFEYSVKLSNGIIKLPMELVDDFERARNAISVDRYRSAALAFQPSQPVAPTPPPAVTPQTVTATQQSAAISPSESATKGWGKILLKVAIATVIVIIIFYVVGQIQEQRTRQDVADVQKTYVKNNIRSYVTARGSTYQYRRIGGISGLSITVVNNTDYVMDLVKVRVAYIKQSGGVYKYEELSFTNINARSTMTLSAPDSDRGTSAQFAIESISSSALGL